MNENKQIEKILEGQYMKKIKHFYRSIANINIQLAEIHRHIASKINKEKYETITNYVNQYISYTSIWNIKFVYNLENPEVALMQFFHLEYIFNNEPNHHFQKERKIYEQQWEAFQNLNTFKPEHIKYRKQKLLQYLKDQEKNSAPSE